MPANPCLNPQQFMNLLLTQTPIFSQDILADIRPMDGFIGHANVGEMPSFSGTSQTKDRYTGTWPNTAKKWETVLGDDCLGAPCDPTEHEICWGTQRITFGQKRQSWRSPMICYDRAITRTHAVEHVAHIVEKVLKPASSAVASMFLRKTALDLAGNKLLANATMSTFTGSWETVGDEERYYLPSAWPTSKLTPEMLMDLTPRMQGEGYFGEFSSDPFWGGYAGLGELVTDMDTAWEMEHMTNNPRIADLWRFQQWTAAHDYYKYGMGGQVGDFMLRVDPFALRFNRRADGRAELVLPYKNESATTGLRSNWNDAYKQAQYQMSFVWHRFAMKLLVQDMAQIHPSMPFVRRGLNGQWNFAINDLGPDCKGLPIANYRQNKGFYYADFQYWAEPDYTEFLYAIFHKREPRTIYTVDVCHADPGYPAQTFNSACDDCDSPYFWVPDARTEDGHYVLLANTVTCGGAVQTHVEIDSATLAAFVVDLEASALGALGDWTQENGLLYLTGSTCRPILPFVV